MQKTRLPAPFNRGDIADLPLLRTLLAIRQKSREPSFWEVMYSFVFVRICKFGSLKNRFATITSLSELYLRIRRFFSVVQTKKWFLWTMAAAQGAENHGDEWGLTWYFLCGIYTSIPTWTQSQMITKTIPISTRVVISYAMTILELNFQTFWLGKTFFSQVYFEEITLCLTLINVLKVLHLFERVALRTVCGKGIKIFV